MQAMADYLTPNDLTASLARHSRAVLQFSGGKDSTALLFALRPWLDRIEVVHLDTGGQLPHVAEHVQKVAAAVGAKLTIVRPTEPVMQFTERTGLPADVLPIWRTPGLAWLSRDSVGQLVQPAVTCCDAMIFQPLMQHLAATGATLVLRGAKACDARRGVPSGTVEGGIEVQNPLWNWTDDDVFAYLGQVGAPVLPHYAAGVGDGIDCWACTAFLTADYGLPRVRHIRDHYPELWPVLRDRLERMRAATAAEWSLVQSALHPVLDEVA
jgi:3'-phosphoadenosine 5'-phosphosulfate sulfotransferase (PAPS reductase)/FAD synthetase